MNEFKFYMVRQDLLKEAKPFEIACEADQKWNKRG